MSAPNTLSKSDGKGGKPGRISRALVDEHEAQFSTYPSPIVYQSNSSQHLSQTSMTEPGKNAKKNTLLHTLFISITLCSSKYYKLMLSKHTAKNDMIY